MKDSLLNTSASVQVDSLMTDGQKVENNNQFWIYSISVILIFALILFIINSRKKKTKKITNIKQEILNGEIDFKNIIDSSFNSKKLYDELKRKCHPDRFVHDSKQNEIANQIFQEITKNKNNIKALNELKQKAEYELNIKF